MDGDEGAGGKGDDGALNAKNAQSGDVGGFGASEAETTREETETKSEDEEMVAEGLGTKMMAGIDKMKSDVSGQTFLHAQTDHESFKQFLTQVMKANVDSDEGSGAEMLRTSMASKKSKRSGLARGAFGFVAKWSPPGSSP
eukprot:g30067.t1